MKKGLLALLFLLCCGSASWAQPLSGTYNLPVPAFRKLKDILQYMNDSGVSAPVVITLSEDDTAITGGYIIGSPILNSGPRSIDLTRQVRINGNGRILTAPAGSGSTDGIFKLVGADWITLENITLREAATNTTATTRMEWGFALLKRNVDDGVQNVTIQNCRIMLNNANTTPASGVSPLGATGIFVGHCLPASTALLGAPSDGAGAHTSLFFFKDTIENTNHGIYAHGAHLTVDGVNINDYGITAQANQISNFTHAGIALSFFNNDLVRENRINNMADGGTAATDHHLYGISYSGDVGITGNNSWTCEKNNIELTSATSGNFETYGIYTGINGSGTTTISEDTIKLTATGTSSGLIGIYSQNDKGTQTISKNYIHDFSTTSTNSQRVAAIYNGYSATWALPYPAFNYPASSVIDANLMERFSVYSGTFDNIAILHVCSDVNLTANPTTFTNNTMNDIAVKSNSLRFFGYGSTYLNTLATASTATITGNTFTNFSSAGTSTPTYVVWPRAAYSGRTAMIRKNRISGVTGGTGLTVALALDYGTYSEVSADTITNVTGEGIVAGIYAGSSDYALNSMQIDHNLVSKISSSGTSGMASGIRVNPGTLNITTSARLFNNTVSGVEAAGAEATATGICFSGGTFSGDVHNNVIADIAAASNTAAYSSCFGVQLLSSGTNLVQYNTIFQVSGAGASGYGATGLMLNPAGNNTVQNNIVNVNVEPAGDNNVAAIRMSGGSATAAPSVAAFGASNNIYYTPAVKNAFLYVEGTHTLGLVNGYNVSGLEQNPVNNIVNDTFFNSDCKKSSYHRFMQQASVSREQGTYTESNLVTTGISFAPAGISYAEAGAVDIAAIGDDIADVPRTSGASDIGALEFNGTTRPLMNITVTSSTGFVEACVFRLPRLSVSVPAFFNRVAYQWYADATLMPGATGTSILVGASTATYTVEVYDSVTGCTYVSEPFLMTIVPPPPSIITYYDSLIFCETSAVVLNGNKGKDYSYQWYKDGIPLPGANFDYLVADETGNYSVEVNTPLGCATFSAPLKVTVYPLPLPTIFRDMYGRLSTQKYYTYQWFDHNVEIPGAVNQTYTGGTGAYTVQVTDSNGCTNMSMVYLHVTDIPEEELAAQLRIYPNPVQHILHIESPVSVSAIVTDVTGRVVGQAAEGVKEMDMSAAAEGIYLLQLYRGTHLVKTEKITRGR